MKTIWTIFFFCFSNVFLLLVTYEFNMYLYIGRLCLGLCVCRSSMHDFDGTPPKWKKKHCQTVWDVSWTNDETKMIYMYVRAKVMGILTCDGIYFEWMNRNTLDLCCHVCCKTTHIQAILHTLFSISHTYAQFFFGSFESDVMEFWERENVGPRRRW